MQDFTRDASLRPLLVLSALLCACRPAASTASRPQSAGSSAVGVGITDAAVADVPLGEEPHPTDALAQWPAMPQQSEPWSALDRSPIAEATQWLFEHGMPDPRGLEYVRARVTVGELWSGAAHSVDATGWLFRAPDNTPWFLGWNGNLYTPESPIAPADLAADLSALTAAASDASDTALHRRFTRSRGGEAGSLTPSLDDPLTHSMLLRLGQRPARALDPQQASFSAVVAAYQWALFDRAVCAHMRGDDLTTLRVSTRLMAVRAAHAQRHASHAVGDAAAAEPDETAFAQSAGRLRADARRRIINGPRARSVVADPAANHGDAGAARVAAMPAPTIDAPAPRSIDAQARAIIDELDDVDARQWGQPGGVDLASDRRVAALIALGEPAVPALIDALERDERLTRSVHFWRDFSRHRSVLGAHEAAYAALAAILQQDFFRVASTGDDLSGRGPAGREELARRVRAYWTRMGSIPLHQRALATLADDSASLDEWVDAAQNIVSTRRPDGSVGPMAGEPLRAQRAPSVSELLARRIERALVTRGRPPEVFVDYAPRIAASRLTAALQEWEPRSSLLRVVTERWLATQTDEVSANCLGALLDARDAAGDAGAIDEYARWIAGISPEQARGAMRALLALAVRRASDARIVRATNVVLSERGWLSDTHDSNWSEELFAATEALPAMRAFVLRRLREQREIGVLSVQQAQFELRYPDGGLFVSGTTTPAPPQGRWPWRACDEIARMLVPPGAERDQLFGPVAQRDAVITRLLARRATRR